MAGTGFAPIPAIPLLPSIPPPLPVLLPGLYACTELLYGMLHADHTIFDIIRVEEAFNDTANSTRFATTTNLYAIAAFEMYCLFLRPVVAARLNVVLLVVQTHFIV